MPSTFGEFFHFRLFDSSIIYNFKVAEYNKEIKVVYVVYVVYVAYMALVFVFVFVFVVTVLLAVFTLVVT